MPKYRKLYVKAVESLDINEMPDDFTRLLWLMLPLGLDAEGRGMDNMAWIKAKVMPLRMDVSLETIEQAFRWYEERGMIERYEVDGRKYFHLPTWHIYQGDTRKEAISNFPAPYSRATPEPVQSYSGTDADSDSDAQGEADADAAPAAPSSPTPDYSAENQFSNPMPVRAERLYQQVTGQVSIPSDIAGEAIPNLIAVLDHYNGHDPGRAQREGKAIFARWCATVGKNRKQYSKTNPGWIGWWMEQIAPKPDEPAPAEEVPKPTAMCSEGYNLYQRARRDAKHLLGYEQHIKRCRVCGEAITSEQVLEKIHELTERMRSP